jgi:hypothetical protein
VGRSPRFTEVLILKLDSSVDYSNPAAPAVRAPIKGLAALPSVGAQRPDQ